MATQVTNRKELALALVQGLAYQYAAGAATVDTVQAAALEAARLGVSCEELYRVLRPLNVSTATQ